jgi:hypothetical protein
MRRLIVFVLVLVNLLRFSPAHAQDDAHTLTVANWTFDVQAAVKAPFFMDTIHLGTLDDGRDWLVVTMIATNTSGEKQELHSDEIQLRSGGEMFKQTGDESDAVADELGYMSIGGSFPHDIEAGKVFEIVQVFKVSPEAASNSLIFDFSGEWEIPLDDLIAGSGGDPSPLVIGGTTDQDAAAERSPWTIETASYQLDLIGAATAPTFSGPFHLGNPGDGQDWLVVTYQLTNLRDGDTEVKADSHKLLTGGEELKQATDETKTVSSELGISMLTLELKPGEPVDVVQVFKVPSGQDDYTLQISARGKLFVNLAPVLAFTNGDGNAVVPGGAVDLAQIDTGTSVVNAVPTAVPTNTPVPTDAPQPTEVPESAQDAVPTEPSAEVDDTSASESSEPTAASDSSSSQAHPGAALAGRLGGTLTEVEARFGEPSWTDAGLIGYNSVSLGGTDAILVIYYDPDETVSKISMVYLQRPAPLDASSAIETLVAEVAPLDGACVDDLSAAPSWGYDVAVCVSNAVETVFDQAYLQDHALKGTPGSYSFAIDPTDDEYFEIVVQAGIDSDTPAPTAIPTATTPPTAAPSLEELYPPVADVRDLTIGRGYTEGDPLSVSGTVQTIFVDDDFSQIQVAVGAPDGTSHWVLVVYQGDSSGVYEGTWVTVYGNYAGSECFENTFGGEVCQPLIVSDSMVW